MSTPDTMAIPAATNDPWEMEVGTGGSDYENCPPGNYPGNVVALIDVGMQQETSKDGEAFQARKLVVAFKLVKKDSKGKPFVVAERYTWSMRDNSNFYALASGLTGRKFAQGETFSPKSIAGMPCMVQIIARDGRDKKGNARTYSNIGSVAQFPEGLPFPTVDSPPLCWSVREGKPLPDVSWVPRVYGDDVAKMVRESDEYAKGLIPEVKPLTPAEVDRRTRPMTQDEVELGAGMDEIPF